MVLRLSAYTRWKDSFSLTNIPGTEESNEEGSNKASTTKCTEGSSSPTYTASKNSRYISGLDVGEEPPTIVKNFWELAEDSAWSISYARGSCPS